MTEKAEGTPVDETAAFEVVTDDAGVPPSDEGKPKEDEPGATAAPAEGDKPSSTDDPKAGEEKGPEQGKETGKEKPAASDTGEDTKAKKPGRLQKRIDRLTKRAAEAERRAAEAEAALAVKKPEPKPKASATPEEPDPEDFETYDEYLEEWETWKEAAYGTKKPKTEEAKPDTKPEPKEAAETPDQEFQDALEDVNEAFADTRAKHEDFDEVIGDKDLTITRDMVLALAEAEDPGAIAYHLGKHKEEAARIAALPPLAQAKEIGKLEVLVAKQEEPETKAPPTKKATAAPDPIDPVSGSDASTPELKDMSFSEYERTMNAKEKARSGGFW